MSSRPLLWKKIRRGLSAGRVQSVATRMVDDRDREIEAFQPEEYWTLDANLLGSDVKKLPFAARYHGKDGKKAELKSAEEVDAVVWETENAAFPVKSVKRTDKQRSPSPPFTTSTMQQEASRKLSMTPRRTMAIAQQLYEGVDIEGEGAVGLITYMRTDSLRITEEALAAAKTLHSRPVRQGLLSAPDPPLQGQGRAPRMPTRPSVPATWTGRRSS